MDWSGKQQEKSSPWSSFTGHLTLTRTTALALKRIASIALAVDTGIADVIITGDLNFNCLDLHSRRTIDSFCTPFFLFQTIEQPTSFTEHSSSFIDIILVSDKHHLILNGVGDAFLN